MEAAICDLVSGFAIQYLFWLAESFDSTRI
jgi:hypothetical protein